MSVLFLLSWSAVLSAACGQGGSQNGRTVGNPEDVTVSVGITDEHVARWPAAPVGLDLAEFGISSSGYFVVYSENIEIASQADDLDGDGHPDELFLLLDLRSDTDSRIVIARSDDPPTYPSRTQAIVAVRNGGTFSNGLYVDGSVYEPVSFVNVPDDQEQDSDWAMFEGPVWESDLIGFRYYLDDRNRTDIFGKRIPALVLHSVEGDYHAIGEWGADILKVGGSLGLGSPAVLIGETLSLIDNAESRTVEVVASGPLRSILRSTHTGWKVAESHVNVVSELEIHAGQRWTEQRLTIDGLQDDARLATGIVRHPAASELHTGEIAGVYYMYTWGAQSDQGHNLGMAILVPQRFDPVVHESDPASHVVTFLADGGRATYRYLAAWELESTPIPDRESFEMEVRLVAMRWGTAIEVARG